MTIKMIETQQIKFTYTIIAQINLVVELNVHRHSTIK